MANASNPGQEPQRLRDGKAFHRRVERFYRLESEFRPEQAVRRAVLVERPADFDDKAPWRYTRPEKAALGRCDALLVMDAERSVAIVEAKNTDWDVLAARGTLEPNLARYARQVWRYLEGIAIVRDAPGGDVREVDLARVESRYAALVFPKAPSGAGVRERIEQALDPVGISAIWFDEPPAAGTPARRAWDVIQAESR